MVGDDQSELEIVGRWGKKTIILSSFSYSRPARELPPPWYFKLFTLGSFQGFLVVQEPALTLDVNPWTFTLIKLERMELAMHSITNLAPMKEGLPTPISFLFLMTTDEQGGTRRDVGWTATAHHPQEGPDEVPAHHP